MDIRPGITVLNKTKTPTSHFIGITSSIHASENRTTSDAYEDNAFLVSDQWRSLTEEEMSVLNAGKENVYSYSNTILVGDLPEKITAYFEKINLKSVATKAEAYARLKADMDIIKALNTELNQFIYTYCPGKYEFYALGISKPNHLSVTSRDNTDKYYGLHIDRSSMDRTIHNADMAFNRLCINLGREPRYLIFLNQTVKQLAHMLVVQKKVKSVAELTIYNLSQIFLTEFSEYPITRIKLEPYQFYIAPTDNCIHDGSTLDSSSIDITMHYLGDFTNLN